VTDAPLDPADDPSRDEERTALLGLTVRWSLRDAPAETARALEVYVEETSHARFTGLPGLRFKTWRMRPGEWFEGTYVFSSEAARASFQQNFEAGAADAAGSRIVGSPPVLVEPWEVVAVAEGGEGFVAAAAYR
jgi:hypothetical protein